MEGAADVNQNGDRSQREHNSGENGHRDQEKRAVLLSWVRDELVIEQVVQKAAPELELTSRIDAVIEALAHYDPLAASEYRSALATIRRASKQRFRWPELHALRQSRTH